MASVEINQMLAAAAAACDDKKAEDIRILALDPAESGLTDYFLICTGSNDRQTVAITDEIEIRLKREFSTYPNSVEGRRQGEWILMDYVDFIVHVFLPEKRAYYGLERLRPSATTLSVAELNADIKAAISAHRPPRPAAKAAGNTSQPAAVLSKATRKSAAGKSGAKTVTSARASAKRTLPAAKKAARTATKQPAKKAVAKSARSPRADSSAAAKGRKKAK